MKLIAYYRGDNEGRRLIEEFSSGHNAAPLEIICDEPGAYSGFRWLQNVIKREGCDTVLIPSLEDLGEDRYIVLENRLFLKRNGAKLICIKRSEKYSCLYDGRRPIVLQAARLFNSIVEWDTCYGLAMPLRDSFDEFKRKPPFGYKVESGKVCIAPEEAAVVNYVFDEFINGAPLREIYFGANELIDTKEKPFGNMTVKTLLRNERYIGRQSKKGYHLPAIIRYDKWLKAQERLEKLYGREVSQEPFCAGSIRSAVPYSCCRCEANTRVSGCKGYRINSERLEERIEELIGRIAVPENAEKLFRAYVVNERAEAESALPAATEAYENVRKEFSELLVRLKAGERGEELQRRLEWLTDVKTVYGMRVRRIRSEIELFSVTEEQLKAFFERCAEMSLLSTEEKRFISEAFVKSVRLKEGRADIFLASPLGSKPLRVDASDILR